MSKMSTTDGLPSSNAMTALVALIGCTQEGAVSFTLHDLSSLMDVVALGNAGPRDGVDDGFAVLLEAFRAFAAFTRHADNGAITLEEVAAIVDRFAARTEALRAATFPFVAGGAGRSANSDG